MKTEEKEIKQEVINILKGKVKPKRRIHRGYKEFEDFKYKVKIPLHQLFGRWQYIYSTRKGKISLICLKNYPSNKNRGVWEIYCLKGNLFEDCERFRTKKNAEKRINELLI